MKQPIVAIAALLAALPSLPAQAQNPDPMDIRACAGIQNDAQRLACYDKAVGRDRMPAAQKHNVTAAAAPGMFARDVPPTGRPLSLLDSRWELSPESKLGTFNIRGYKPVYVMPVFVTSNQNERPTSPNPNNTVRSPQELQDVEMKFQLSLKTKVWQGVFGDKGDLWVGYTQSSRWQAYNAKISRPFRETDYQPEAMLVFGTHYRVLGCEGRLLGIGVDHQSNGRSDPLSRSWNRVIADVGFERGDWTLMIRPWWRIPEARQDDNNPDISDYIGRADMQLVHEWHGQEFALMLRHSLRGGSRSHGAGRFTWSFPLAGNVRGYMEFFKGYGESLIDYNHNATYLGLGISLVDWY